MTDICDDEPKFGITCSILMSDERHVSICLIMGTDNYLNDYRLLVFAGAGI